MAELVSTLNPRLDLKHVSQFRYTQARIALKRRQIQSKYQPIRVLLPELNSSKSPVEVLTRTIIQQKRCLERVSLSYSRMQSPAPSNTKKQHRRIYNGSL